MDEPSKIKNEHRENWVYYLWLQKQLEKCVTQQINVVGDTIDRSSCISYLGAFLDRNLTLKEHIKRKSTTSIRNVYKIKKIRKFLTAQATETLVLGLVISHLDYGNSLLIGCPPTTLDIYQKVQNMCAKLFSRGKSMKVQQKHSSHYTGYWSKQRIDYKLLCIAHNCKYGKAPQYLKDLLINKTVIRSLHSSKYANTDFIVPFNQCKTFVDSSFLYYAPKLWNGLPTSIKQITQLDAFRKLLKHFFLKKIIVIYLFIIFYAVFIFFNYVM